MTIREIIRMGHPTLRQVARPLSTDEIQSETTERLVEDMIDTLESSGGIGLAAPQINESVRLAIIEITQMDSRYGELEPLPLTVFVNPVITILEETMAGSWEGCLSIPGLRGWVERSQKILVEYLDLELNNHKRVFSAFHATVCQHEFDHLDGRLYVDHVQDMRNLMFESEMTHLVHSD